MVRIVCDIVVDRLCDIVAGGTIVHGAVVLGAVVRTVELFGRDGGATVAKLATSFCGSIIEFIRTE